jgi:hypothetical protein
MRMRPYVTWVLGLFAFVLAACAGGSGSSGFDSFPSAENAAIDTALEEQRCVVFEGLNICPAGATPMNLPEPSPTPTATGTPVPVLDTPKPSGTVAATPTATPTRPPPTPTGSGQPRVETAVDGGEALPCVPVDATSTCLFVLPFVPEGFPAGTTFRVAVRTLQPQSAWVIGPSPTVSGPVDAPLFDAPIAVDAATRDPLGRVPAQLAVLAFTQPPAELPAQVQTLVESGADFAFVTDEITLQPTLPRGMQLASVSHRQPPLSLTLHRGRR